MFLLDPSLLHRPATEQLEALLSLICHLAYKEGSFTLSSGRQSDYYINCKCVSLHPQGAYLIGQRMLAQLPSTTQAIAGLTLGADPIVTAVSLASVASPSASLSNLPALIVRKQAKSHGTQAWLEGLTLAPGTRVWILEDVVTTGQSAIQAAERVQASGYCVEGILTLVDREEGAQERFESLNIPFQSIFKLAQIRDYYRHRFTE